MNKWVGIFLIGVLALASSGCATIVHGTSTRISILSDPPGAIATVNDRQIVTPGEIILKNNHSYTIQISKDGYRPYVEYVDQKMSGWVWGNILIGGIIGVCIDYASGGAYKLTPKEIKANLQQQ